MGKTTKDTNGPSGRHISIADCVVCKQIPQKLEEDQERVEPSNIPPEIGKLSVVVEFDDPNTGANSTSTTKLLKCGYCGTYYYHNHFIDHPQDFMDPPIDEVTIRRYSPATAIWFLDRIANASGGPIPNALGQLVKAIADGTAPRTPGMRVKGDGILAAAMELTDLRGRFESIIKSLEADIMKKDLFWHAKMYAIDALLPYYLARKNLDAVTRVLLTHEDPAVRVETAVHIWDFCADNAPLADLVHLPREELAVLQDLLSNKAFMQAVTQVLIDLACSGEAWNTLAYDHGYGSSRYYEKPVQLLAIAGLAVASEHIDLSGSIPAFVSLLRRGPQFTYHASWLLRKMVYRIAANARLVLDELDFFSAVKDAELLKNEDVVKLLQECRAKQKESK